MVIVILGILAAVAIPKYVNMKGDASDASARGITGAMRGALSILYAKNLLGDTNTAYDMADIVDSAQISGVEDSTTVGTYFTATIGGSAYVWTLTPSPELPTTAGGIVVTDHITW